MPRVPPEDTSALSGNEETRGKTRESTLTTMTEKGAASKRFRSNWDRAFGEATMELVPDNPSDETNGTVEPAQDTDPENPSAPRQPAIVPHVPPAPANAPQAARSRQEGTPPWKITVEIGALVVAVGLLVVNIFQAAATKEAATSAKSAAETAAHQLEAAERPWIFASSVTIAGPLVFDKDGAHVQITFMLKDGGPSPAVRGMFEFRLTNFIFQPDPFSQRDEACRNVEGQSALLSNRHQTQTWFPVPRARSQQLSI